ncbi:hypothetical protein HAZT_HAZT006945 [Hyalella azteca]|uniref:Uncharacterized protein n=1 Tax=Hyalella azteca TaxID=294128 RepID=A0A6A0H7A1_HYAAZ|nr:hypothetical protein HAZT_HAZT006945 [Hyalella azteca]
MSEESESVNEEERSLFRPFTRESLAALEARIAEEHAKQKELQKKKEEAELRLFLLLTCVLWVDSSERYTHVPTVRYSHIPTVRYTHIPTVRYTHIPTVRYTHIPTVRYTHIPTKVSLK